MTEMQSFSDIKQKVDKYSIQYESDKNMLAERRKRLEEIKNELEAIRKSQVLVQEVASKVQSQISIKIDGIVNLGLALLFPEYTFKLEYVPMRGKTEVQFNVYQGNEPIDIMQQNGGGTVDVVAFCLRVAVFAISNCDNILIADEPHKFLSKSLRPKIAELMKELSEKLNLQFIYVTHIDELADVADNRIQIKKINGVSEVVL